MQKELHPPNQLGQPRDLSPRLADGRERVRGIGKGRG